MLTTNKYSQTAFSLFLGLIFISFTPLQAPAQLDWLKKGQGLLDKVTKPQAESVDSTPLSEAEIGQGLREALRVGSERVVVQLGAQDGFNADPEIHIPLPDSFAKVRSALGTIGMSGMLDDLELQLNRAAETATPKAKQLFFDAIEAMTLDDVMKIYNGPEDAATRYFEGKMSPPLAEAMRPVVATSLQEVGAVKTYDAVLGKYQTIPFVPDIQADLTGYVVEKGMAGIFHYLSKEEAAIRSDPLKRTTDLLQQVFGR